VAFEGKSKEEAAEAVRLAVSALDKAAEKGVIHRNNASRRKARLMKQLAQMK
jgi:small subunit ribosomal protein S20